MLFPFRSLPPPSVVLEPILTLGFDLSWGEFGPSLRLFSLRPGFRSGFTGRTVSFRLPCQFASAGRSSARVRRFRERERGLPSSSFYPPTRGNPGHAQLASLKVSVYPRVGGEPKDNDGNLAQNQGLSPRGRGTRWERTREVVSSGSIPAWAGNPEWRRKCTREGAVYPRVGGEPILRRAERRGRKGLSPRGRGTRLLQPVGGAQGRSIPAWAGNPHGPGRLRTQHPVYPRVGGEPDFFRVCSARCHHYQNSWVYPRVGGEPRHPLPTHRHNHGLSPRGRGTRGHKESQR